MKGRVHNDFMSAWMLHTEVASLSVVIASGSGRWVREDEMKLYMLFLYDTAPRYSFFSMLAVMYVVKAVSNAYVTQRPLNIHLGGPLAPLSASAGW